MALYSTKKSLKIGNPSRPSSDWSIFWGVFKSSGTLWNANSSKIYKPIDIKFPVQIISRYRSTLYKKVLGISLYCLKATAEWKSIIKFFVEKTCFNRKFQWHIPGCPTQWKWIYDWFNSTTLLALLSLIPMNIFYFQN